jgi:hypothetical protein
MMSILPEPASRGALVTGALSGNLDANQQGTQNKWSFVKKLTRLAAVR